MERESIKAKGKKKSEYCEKLMFNCLQTLSPSMNRPLTGGLDTTEAHFILW